MTTDRAPLHWSKEDEAKVREWSARYGDNEHYVGQALLEIDATRAALQKAEEALAELSMENAELSRRQEFTAKEVAEARGIDATEQRLAQVTELARELLAFARWVIEGYLPPGDKLRGLLTRAQALLGPEPTAPGRTDTERLEGAPIPSDWIGFKTAM